MLTLLIQAGDHVELYLDNNTTITLSLAITSDGQSTVTVTTNNKGFTARLLYAMSLALDQTQIL